MLREVDAEAERRVARRLARPGVQEALVEAGYGVAEELRKGLGGELEEYPEGVYMRVVDLMNAGAFGLQEGPVNWEEPPVVGEREERFLKVLGKLGKRIAGGELERAGEILKGMNVADGSRADLGLVCAPELLAIVGQVSGPLRKVIEEGKLTREDVLGRRRTGQMLEWIVGTYEKGEVWRNRLALAVFGLVETVNSRERGVGRVERAANWVLRKTGR